MDATENDIIAPTLETAFATIMNSLPPTAEKDLQLIHRLFQKKSDVLTKINEFLLHLMRHVKPFLLHPTIASKIVPNGDKTALYTHFSIAMALLFVILRKRRSWMLWSQMLLKSTAQVTRIVATAQQLRFLRSNLGVKMPYSRTYLMSTFLSMASTAAILPMKQSPLFKVLLVLVVVEVLLHIYSLYLVSLYNRGLPGPSNTRPSLSSAGRKMNIPSHIGWWIVALLTGHVAVSSLRKRQFQKSEVIMMLSMLPAFLSNMQLGYVASRTSGTAMKPTSSIVLLSASYVLLVLSALPSLKHPLSRLIICCCLASVFSLALNLWVGFADHADDVHFPALHRGAQQLAKL
eukprot:TRINITY_DN1173_c0_g1_i3.p1 TRINITY_DN1173_c0_g1~~TRINITY_DN1173_c0_g1_i3.p1  ORF type:complete len:347 (-),score=71.72 TRINITY_DN1173_c0_g1_i3:17-1057(-)